MSLGRASAIVIGIGLLGLTGCGTGMTVEEPQEYRVEQVEKIRDANGTIHGEDGFLIAGGRPDRGTEGGAAYAGIGVNAFLWRASLETIDFLPLAQADPFGGVIITDWYSPPETPGERFKLNVYILDTVLRADGIKVSVFRQRDDGTGGGWQDSAIDPATRENIEDNILTRARELRIAAISAQG